MADENKKLSAPRGQEPVNPQANNTSPSKTAWPEVVGLSAEEAEKKIKEEMVNAIVQVIPPDHFVTMDFNIQRVRLYLDSTGSVARTATIG